MSDATLEAIEASLSMAAERAGDIVPAVFARFFELSEAGTALMAHSDLPMQGRMFEGTVEMLLSAEALAPGGYLDWELDNHLTAYGATLPMYLDYLAAVRDTVQQACGADWSAAFAAAWDARTGGIMARVEAFSERA